MRDYRVLIIEDEQLTADTYVEYLARAGGYEVVHRSPTMADALRFLKSQWSQQRQSFGVDVVLLDMNLPDGHGLEVLRQMRSAGFTGGVLALTGATELKTIRQAIALGVVQYLVKPFGYQHSPSGCEPSARSPLSSLAAGWPQTRKRWTGRSGGIGPRGRPNCPRA